MATLDFIGNPNIRNILFMAETSGECVAVSTFCRKHNRRGRFLLIRERLHELLNEAPRDFYDMDCNRYVRNSIPNGDFSDFSCSVWEIMVNLVRYGKQLAQQEQEAAA